MQKHDVPPYGRRSTNRHGRTGTLFCYEQYGIEPDVITSSLKSTWWWVAYLVRGLCTERLGEVLNSGMHGSTFGGNPVA